MSPSIPPFVMFATTALEPSAALLLKVTAVLGAGAAIAAALRHRAAATRHEVWLLALAAALALAVLAPLAPAIEVPMLPASLVSARPAAIDATHGSARPAAVAQASTRAPDSTRPQVEEAPAGARSLDAGVDFPMLLVALWALGTALVVLRCVVGHVGLVRLAGAATPLDSPRWTALLAATQAVAGVRQPVRLLRSAAVATPVTWGARRPVIVMPAAAETWPDERRRAALLHELAHVARRDSLAQLAGMAACAVYWFHPAAWMALRRLRRESELACDDRVLAWGTPPAEYAAQLLEVARGAYAQRLGGAALAIGMARPSTLEGRLVAVLDESVPRRALGRRPRLVAAAALAIVLTPLAGITAVRASFDPVLAPRGAAGGEVLVSQGGASGAEVVASLGDIAGGGARHAGTSGRAAAQGGEAPGCSTHDGDVFECSVAAEPGEELRLDLDAGASVEIRGWDEPRVELDGKLETYPSGGSRASMQREAGGVRVRAWYDGSGRSRSTSHRFEIRVPRRFDVRIESSGGDLTLTGIEGTFEGETGGGDLVLTDLRGRADLSTGGGEIRVTDSTLAGEVSTGGGLVTLSRVGGGLRGSSGSGPVVYVEPESGDPEDTTGDLDGVDIGRSGNRIGIRDGVESSGPLHITRAGGEIELAEAPRGAVVETGGGDIDIGRAAGVVDASTGGGDIRIGPVAGSVSAGTGAGDVEVTIADAGGEPQTVEVHSGNGRIVIELPEDFDGRIELETAYTRRAGPTKIEAPWELERSTSDWDDREGTPRRYVRARGSVGSGSGLVKVKTVNGDVVVREAGG